MIKLSKEIVKEIKIDINLSDALFLCTVERA